MGPVAEDKTLQQAPKKTVTITTDHGDIILSAEIVRRYLVNGNGSVTDQEVMMFMALCKHQGLNPFIREAYLIKYGSEQPATIVVGKEVFTKRAHKITGMTGFKAGVIVQDVETKAISETLGYCPPGSAVMGGWAEVHLSSWTFPLRIEVDLKEYEGRTKTGQVTRMWAEKKATMIRKVALVQALREAFPEQFQGMYSPEEISHIDKSLPDDPIQIIDAPPKEPPFEPDKRKRPTKAKMEATKDVAAPHTTDVPDESAVDPPEPKEASDRVICKKDGSMRHRSFCQECEVQEGCPETA